MTDRTSPITIIAILISLFVAPWSRAQATRPIVSDFSEPPAGQSAPPLPPPQTQPVPKPRTGSFQVTFTVRSEKSALEFLSRRLGWSIPAMLATSKTLDYDLSRGTFQLYVPPDYDPATAYGLVVWISPGEGGAVPRPGYLDVFNRHKIIYIGPDNAGNVQYWPVRVGTALDAAANVQSLYRIDARRVYAAGLSGGGRAASMLAVDFPDVFTGGCYVAGCDFYRDVPLNEPKRFWQRNFFPPPKPLFALSKTQSRHVLITGPGDINAEQIECNYKAFLNDGFQHVRLLTSANGHANPDAEELDRALDFLDTIPIPSTEPATRAVAPRAATSHSSTSPASPAQEAESDLNAARLYIQAGLFPQARQRLTRIVAQFPNTPGAKEAQSLLRSIAGK